jgi:CheY-like chemotaxis protein
VNFKKLRRTCKTLVNLRNYLSKEYNISDISFLVVDDCKYMRLIVRTMLSRFGVRKVIEASDAIEALEVLKTNSVDFVIVDQQMEPLDGHEFVRLVRTAGDSANPFIPIVMLTAHTKRETVVQARDAGITEFLGKPVCAKDLYLRIIETLDHPREFIRSSSYFGPDRRRSLGDNYKGPERRRSVFRI